MSEDPTLEQMLDEHPLLLFSLYTESHSKILLEVGQSVLDCLDNGITPNEDGSGSTVSGGVTSYGYSRFWLWVLGAYEVVRTMTEAEQCFAAPLRTKLQKLKQELAEIRMPFAKQELRGQKTPVRGEPSIYGFKDSPPDLLFEVGGRAISARGLITEFTTVFNGITRQDILADHRTTY